MKAIKDEQNDSDELILTENSNSSEKNKGINFK